jgi:hypothetical protein
MDGRTIWCPDLPGTAKFGVVLFVQVEGGGSWCIVTEVFWLLTDST